MKLGFDLNSMNMMMRSFGMMQKPKSYCRANFQNL